MPFPEVEGKRSWPELVGKDGNEAVATIEKENPNVFAIIVPPPNTWITLELVPSRVRVFVDDCCRVTSVTVMLVQGVLKGATVSTSVPVTG